MSKTRREKARHTHQKQKYLRQYRRHGWSRWEAICGIDQRLVPALGRALPPGHPGRETLITLDSAEDTINVIDTPDNATRLRLWNELLAQEHAAFDALAENMPLVRSLSIRHGINPVRAIGHTLMELSTFAHGAPFGYGGNPDDPDTETNFDLWCLDLFRHGWALAHLDNDTPEALRWVGRHVHKIWD